MKIYEKIKKDTLIFIVVYFAFTLVFNMFNIGIDDSDLNGFNRSGVVVITDYKTGLQYLYKGGTIVPRLNLDGAQMTNSN